MKKKILGLIGYGMVGQAIHAGFSTLCDFRIYDKNKTISLNTFEETIRDSDYIFICVPSPMIKETGRCDTSIVEKTIGDAEFMAIGTGKIFIIKSTIPPGTTRKLIEKYRNLRIIFNPEFLTARTSRLDFINSSRIILGGNVYDCEEVEELYRKRFPSTPIFITNPTTAEMVKYSANCFFSVKVAFMNELYQICDKLGINYDDVKDMMVLDGRIGNSHLDVPGHDGKCGFSGLCFPKDINALIYLGKQLGIDPCVMESAWKKNLEVRPEKDWEKIKGCVKE